jgi:hypothetical protein
MNHRASVRELWHSYRADVLPADAGSIQISECRRAFYAGAQALMVAVMVGLDPDREPTSDDAEYMGNLQRELETFATDTEAGRI